MADKNPKTETKDVIEDNQRNLPVENPSSLQPKPIGKQKPISDPLLEFISLKEKVIGSPITDRSISLLRREISKNPNVKIEEIWRRIYG
jgi:hypothetical protein